MRLDATPDCLDGAGDSYHVSGRAWRNGHNAPRRRLAGRASTKCSRRALRPRSTGARRSKRPADSTSSTSVTSRTSIWDSAFGCAGTGCLYVHDAVVRHVSSALSGYRSDFAVYHGERNSVWTFFKNMPAPLFWLYLPQHLALNVASLFFYPFRGQGRAVWRAKWHALLGLRNVLAQRREQQRQRRADWRALRDSMARGPAAPYLSRYGVPPVALVKSTRAEPKG